MTDTPEPIAHVFSPETRAPILHVFNPETRAPILTVHPDGRITLGDEAQPTEAAAQCIEVMAYTIRGMIRAAIAEAEAENARLREALGWFLNDSRFVVQVGGNPNVVPQMIEAARQALGDKTND
jgi:hypothetical protein